MGDFLSLDLGSGYTHVLPGENPLDLAPGPAVSQAFFLQTYHSNSLDPPGLDPGKVPLRYMLSEHLPLN